jgi:hypothetical protein
MTTLIKLTPALLVLAGSIAFVVLGGSTSVWA